MLHYFLLRGPVVRCMCVFLLVNSYYSLFGSYSNCFCCDFIEKSMLLLCLGHDFGLWLEIALSPLLSYACQR